MDELIARIKGYLHIINKNIDTIDRQNAGLINFCIGEIIDRTIIYLNSETIPTRLERILADVVNTGLKKCLKDIELSQDDNSNIDKAITGISDNGQSVSYANEVTTYFSTASDNEIFSGFVTLLNRYRRITVVYPKNI